MLEHFKGQVLYPLIVVLQGKEDLMEALCREYHNANCYRSDPSMIYYAI